MKVSLYLLRIMNNKHKIGFQELFQTFLRLLVLQCYINSTQRINLGPVGLNGMIRHQIISWIYTCLWKIFQMQHTKIGWMIPLSNQTITRRMIHLKERTNGKQRHIKHKERNQRKGRRPHIIIVLMIHTPWIIGRVKLIDFLKDTKLKTKQQPHWSLYDIFTL